MSSYEKNEGLNSLISLNYSIIKRKKKNLSLHKIKFKRQVGQTANLEMARYFT